MDAQQSEIETLRTSEDADALREAAVTLAAEPSAEGLRALRASLTDAAFLARLDSDADYDAPPRTLRVAPVLDELAASGHDEARGILVALTTSAPFQERMSRTELLILACAKLRPPPAPVVEFWRAHFMPDDSSSPLVVQAILENGSEAALALFEAEMASAARPRSDKLFWLRHDVVPHRDDPGFLDAARRLEADLTDDELRVELIRVIFDYDQGWYPPEASIRPPAPASITPDANAILQDLAHRVLASPRKLPPDLKIAVVSRLDR